MTSDFRVARLLELSRMPAHALELGKAAEHLVCADLMMQGYRAFLSDQGLPYDLLVDVGGRLIRVQVKSTCFARNANSKGRASRMAYVFNARRRGKKGASRLSDDDCDVLAFVALDIKEVAYLPTHRCAQTVALDAPDGRVSRVGRGGRGAAHTDRISDYPFPGAIA